MRPQNFLFALILPSRVKMSLAHQLQTPGGALYIFAGCVRWEKRTAIAVFFRLRLRLMTAMIMC